MQPITRTLHLPLVVALVFGLLLSLVPATPVFSDNIGVCQPTSNLSAGEVKVSIAGQNITPSLLLRTRTSAQPCSTNETALGLVVLTRTILVSPVAAAAPTANGQALLDALTTIANASPSVTNPWLLKLEPGIYYLGNNQLTLLPYVDLEGSGEGTTVISSTIAASTSTTATLKAASNSQIRFVSIANSGTSDTQVSILVPANTTNVRLSYVSASGSGAANVSSGLAVNAGATVVANNSTFEASGSPIIYAIYNNGTITLTNSTASASGGSVDTTALFNNQPTSKAYVLGSNLNATGSTINHSLTNSGQVTIQSSSLTASGGSVDNNNIFNNSSGQTVTVQSSFLTASGGSSNNAIFNRAVTQVSNTIFSVSGGSTGNTDIFNQSGTTRVANSQLNNVFSQGGNIVCFSNYKADFTAFNC